MKIYSDTVLFPNTIICVSLLNEYGNPVIISSPEYFSIYEDGKKGGKLDSVYLFSEGKFLFLFLIDASKNMKDKDIRLIQMVLWNIFKEKEGKNNIITLLFADTLIPLLTENEEIRFDLIEKRFNNIRNLLKRKEAKLIDMISLSILNFYEKIKNYMFSCIVVFSKGIDDGSKTGLQDLKKLSIKTQIPVVTVGINEEGDILNYISDSTYGEHIRGKTLNELELAYNKLRFKIINSILLFYPTKILPGDGMPHTIEVMVQNVKGSRIFITPKKKIFRFEFSYIISIGIMVIVITFFIFYNKMRTIKKKKEKFEPSVSHPLKDFIEEKEEIKEEVKEEPRPIKEKTQIFLPYIPVQIKKYDVKEKIIYKNKEFMTDAIVEMEYNEVIKIGSKEDNTLILPGLSPLHFTLKFEYGGLRVDAYEEIYINGEMVKGKAYYKEKGKYIINAGCYVLIVMIE